MDGRRGEKNVGGKKRKKNPSAPPPKRGGKKENGRNKKGEMMEGKLYGEDAAKAKAAVQGGREQKKAEALRPGKDVEPPRGDGVNQREPGKKNTQEDKLRQLAHPQVGSRPGRTL